MGKIDVRIGKLIEEITNNDMDRCMWCGMPWWDCGCIPDLMTRGEI